MSEDIYQAYNQSLSEPYVEDNQANLFVAKTLTRLAVILGMIGIVLLAIAFLPSVWQGLESKTQAVSNLLRGTAPDPVSIPARVTKETYQPRYDAKLPKEGRIKMASIGVDTQIQEATYERYEDALRKGIWRVSDFGTPWGREKPMILTAHRFGYLAWTNFFRRKNSFFNLPKLRIGDTVEVVWKQRKYTYEVYGEARGEEITDYTADLILYTCESLNGPIRIFKYARLLEI